MNKILEITNLTKSYKGFSLKNINISLERGYIMGFIGPNGTGKSTTIKLIMNLIKKDKGEIKIFGLDNEADEIAIKDRIGFVYDENHYYEDLTVNEMKNFIKPFYNKWEDDTFYQYAKKFHLPLDKKIKNLSKGMKMKFSLAIALSHDAELLIMDEPTSGLDPVIRSELLDVLQTMMEDEKKAVFFSTHITSDLDKVADYITLIHDDEIIFSKTKDEIMEEHCIVKGPNSLLDTPHQIDFIGLKQSKFGFEALCNNKKIVQELFGDSVIMEKPNLEEIMVYYTKGSDLHAPSH